MEHKLQQGIEEGEMLEETFSRRLGAEGQSLLEDLSDHRIV